MLAIVLALGASLGWGVSDFLGGLKSRTLPVLSVLLISQGTALILLTLIAATRGVALPDASTLGHAAIAGLGELAGIAALYRGLSVGKMSIVAPVAATAPAVPLLIGLAGGQIPGPLQFTGLALALLGLAATSYRPGTTTGAASSTLPSILYGLLAAAGFGIFFHTMHNAGEGDVGWALLTARLTSVLALATVIIVKRHRVRVPKADLPVLAAIGALVIVADFLYTTASTLGLVSVAAVLASLHTIVTIALARIVLKERLERPQQIGIAISLIGVLAISAG
ncbi:EamA family transporter [Nonomuraea endophytica]|uniref:Putative membrane protein n=1 Tax=Nonomuraea endophytica TaxID=714136 RepID=A0A7W8A8P5_9ACTN|nr:EamA family transporter [Nonomuraea endophytica]MBB5081659.1 putative membrane protein [Nonomuraea endophytica]